jgi:ABC-type transport system substrate-binding protein
MAVELRNAAHKRLDAGELGTKRNRRAFGAAGILLVSVIAAVPVAAQKQGGILRMDLRDSPPSFSILEESDFVQAMMSIFNNLVLFDQHLAQNSLQSIVPDLATGWSWSEDGTELTFPLRQGIKWHDGKPFTAADVKCTWDLLAGKSSEKLRLNPRQAWYRNLEEVTSSATGARPGADLRHRTGSCHTNGSCSPRCGCRPAWRACLRAVLRR